MVSWRISEATRAMEGTLVSPPGMEERSFSGAAIDSRKVRGGELFFALAGEHTDGHRFVGSALAAGAVAAVVSRPEVEAPPEGALIRVADSFRALHDLTRAVRRMVPEKLIGLTGSVGKTTTKELLAAMLGGLFRVAKSPGNFNNLLGFPLALLGIPDDTEWMVAEMGMSLPGELGQISRLARPDVALLLNVRPAHLENFASLAEVAEAKAEILEGLPETGLLVANADDPHVARVARRHPGRIIWFGHGPQADVRATAIDEAGLAGLGTRFTLSAFGQRTRMELTLHGRYNVNNALAAAACALALGASPEHVAAAARTIRPAAGRGVVHRLACNATVIDDSYNSNPEALKQALESAATVATGRAWAVLGDMLELGERGPHFHREAGKLCAEIGFSPIVAVGQLARELAGEARGLGSEVVWFATADEAASWAARELRAGDLVLVKGSRGAGLERVVQALLDTDRRRDGAEVGASPAAGRQT